MLLGKGYNRTELWHKSLQNVISDVINGDGPTTIMSLRSKALALKRICA